MKKHVLLLAVTAAASGCYSVETPVPPGVGSFQVQVSSVSKVASNGATQPLDVVGSCLQRHGATTTAQVPPEARGKEDCRYVIPRGPVELSLDISALNKEGQPYAHTGPVAFKVVPGDLAGDYTFYWANLTNGRGTGRVRAEHLYGEVRVWVADEPVQPNYVDGRIFGDPRLLPPEPKSRTYAAGASGPVFFEEPTLAALQQPHTADNRSSPFVRQFVTIGRAPESGSVLYQNCADGAPPKPVTLMVTGVDPSGFFVTDITACRVPDASEPGGSLPGSFGSIFVYNFSFPEGLYPGDLLWTLAGSLQEFTGTTQLTFPSWTVREHVRELPPDQWDKYLKLHPPVELNLRHCGLTSSPSVVDTLCGYYNDNMKMESLESGLVKVRRVRFPRVFKNCDLNGNGEVPFFCSKSGAWSYCGDFAPPDNNEVQCNIECTTGSGPYLNTVCSERSQYAGFGQFVAELAGPGPREAGLDDSRSERTQQVLLSDTSSQRLEQGYPVGTRVSIWCDLDTYLRFGDRSVTASNTDELLPAKTRKDVTLTTGQDYVAFLAKALPPPPAEGSTPPPAPRCVVAGNTGTRILLTTKDAVPELRVDCDENDPDATRASQCRLMHEATFDVVGHLRQIQPGRPRWMIMPRDADDLCCHPGPGNQCPRPIKPCQ
jgi:hypothetical protein